MKHPQTKACDFTTAVKEAIWKRDGGRCVYCGTTNAMPNAHFIPRSQGGLGREENGLTLCLACHDRYDNGSGRIEMEAFFENYLRHIYPGWNRKKLFFKKYDFI